ncbi:PAS domain S-box protein [Gillisia sp. M10.2A]|uniref:histidine kinase n=1 Tax=Gillisia lutea TaxID=2909668 RepID=A0ABS9EI83_9FLAO|nr:PAS domain S-box protein [Gillisia lutea]MCF4102536.1 PAS domain S-box protein [Gillisia lutea]
MNYLRKELYELIKEDESIFDFIQDSALDGMWFWDLENPENEWMNPKFWITLGYDPNDMPHKTASWQNIINKDDLEAAVTQVKAHCENPSIPYNQTVRYKHKSGDTVWIQCRGMAIRNHEGKPIRMLGAHTDISNLKISEINLQRETVRFKHIIEGTNLGTWEWNIQTGETIINRRWAEIIGYTLEELEPTTINTRDKFLHPDDLIKSKQLVRDHLNGKIPFYECELRMKHKSGKWVWIADKGKIVNWTKDGEPRWMTGSHLEITKRKEHEILLTKYKDLLERSNEAAVIGTWEVDLVQNIVEWSKVTKQIHEVPPNYSPEMAQALNFYPEGEHRDTILHVIDEAIEKGINYDVELQIFTFKGHLKWVRAIGISEFENGSCVRLYGLFQDIDERKTTSLEIEKLSLVASKTNNAVIITNAAGYTTWVNESFTRSTGYNLDDMLNKKPGEILQGKDTNPKHVECIRKALNDKLHVSQEILNYKKDGSIIWLHLNITPVFNKVGEVYKYIAIENDITERKNIEKLNQERQTLLETILDSIDVGIVSCDKNGNLTLFNNATRDWHGLPVQSIPSSNLSQYYGLFKPDGVTPLSEEEIPLIKALQTGSVKNEELVIIPEKGIPRTVTVNGSKLIGEEGELFGAVVAMHDITKRKATEEKLRETLAKLEGLLDASAYVSIIGTNASGLITTFNKGAENLLGYSREEMISHKTMESIHLKSEITQRSKDLSDLLGKNIRGFSVFTALPNNGTYDTREWTYVKKDDTHFPVQLTITSIKDNNEIIGYLGVAAEISEIKKAENEIKSLLEVTKDQNLRLKNFAHIVSHNLRSHSGNFAMLLDLYKRENPEAAENEMIKLLGTASTNLKETIAHLNEVVLMNSSLKENMVYLNLKDAIDKAIKNVSALAEDANVNIQNSVDPKINIEGLHAYIDSIILNLLTNGIKYRSPERKSFIKFSSEVNDQNILLKVEDNGLGIDLKKYGTKLFGMYKTFHLNKDARGVGLFITKNQIEAIGGKIEVESTVNKGTTFKINMNYEKN